MEARKWRIAAAVAALGVLPVLPAVASDLTDSETEGIVSFFTSYLDAGSGTYEASHAADVAEVDTLCSQVWAAWAEANDAYNEEKLISLYTLYAGRSGSWTLPSSLEPNAVMNYLYGFKGRQPDDGYPLFLYLHGSGDPDSEWATGLSLCKSFSDTPSLYFIPRIPNTGDYYRWYQRSKQYAWEKLLRLAFLSGNVDPNRVYFFGISEGGYGSQRLASFYADYLAGAGPMAGGEPLINAPAENCRHIAFSFLTGSEDTGYCRNQLTAIAQETFDSLEALYPDDYVHRIELLEGYGHAINYSLTTPWLKDYTRQPHPKHVNWEDYAMDGAYRKGFYNLVVTSRPTGSDRVYYQMDIEDNHISLTAQKVSYTSVQTDASTGITLRYRRTYTDVTNGKVLIYLNSDLVDLDSDVTVTVNGKDYYVGRVEPDVKHMVNSCATFFDPERVYPAAIEVDFSAAATDIAAAPVAETSVEGEERYYDLSGRPVGHPGRGVYLTGSGDKVYRR